MTIVSDTPPPPTPVLFFGRYAARLGHSFDVDIPPEGLTVKQLRDLLYETLPDAAEVLPKMVKALVDQCYVHEGALVLPGQEVAFYPPLSGG